MDGGGRKGGDICRESTPPQSVRIRSGGQEYRSTGLHWKAVPYWSVVATQSKTARKKSRNIAMVSSEAMHDPRGKNKMVGRWDLLQSAPPTASGATSGRKVS